MENNAVYYLAIAILVCYGFNLAQGLRVAINRNETVRVIPKVFCSIYCISASLIRIMILPSSYRLISYLHYLLYYSKRQLFGFRSLKNNLEKKYDC